MNEVLQQDFKRRPSFVFLRDLKKGRLAELKPHVEEICLHSIITDLRENLGNVLHGLLQDLV